MLNQRLIDQQGLTHNEVQAIADLHKMREKLFANMEQMAADELSNHREQINQVIEDIEFTMQYFWKFGPNKNMHTWWYRNNVCLCPKMDNDDALGTGFRYHNSSCPLHGDQ